MSKDSYWFRHDSTAGRGTKMRKIAFIYSHWGKGIYWDVIEILRDQENYRYSNEEFDLKMLADLIGCKDEIKFLNWYNDCVKFSLFLEETGVFYSPVLCENMKRWETSKANGSKGGRPKTEKPKNNLNETQSKPNPKPNRNHKSIEEDSIVDNINKEKASIFSTWLNYRIEIGKKIKVESTLKRLIEKFNDMPLEKCKWVVNHSIENNYQGLFWDKYKTPQSSGQPDGEKKVVSSSRKGTYVR